MHDFTPLSSTLGGLAIGGASLLLLAAKGRIAGISGILGTTLQRLFSGPAPGEREGPHLDWRVAFILGLVATGVVFGRVQPEVFGSGAVVSLPLVVMAGFLVGFGTRLGSGCTSGHGVCGVSRFSPRSLAATGVFMATGFWAVAILRAFTGAAA